MPRRIKVRIVDEMGATGWQVLERIRILRLLTLHGPAKRASYHSGIRVVAQLLKNLQTSTGVV
jgi:hypothetical protein